MDRSLPAASEPTAHAPQAATDARGHLTFTEVVAAAGVTDPDGLATDLRQVCGLDPATARFRPATLALEAASAWVCAPETYLLDGDADGYERAVALADAYSSGADVPPVVFGWLADAEGSLQVIDGLHRLSGAAAAGLRQVPAFEALAPAP